MVKFAKELEAKLIPEWRAAYVNYWQLKKHIKMIQISMKLKHSQGSSNEDCSCSTFDRLRSVFNKIAHHPPCNATTDNSENNQVFFEKLNVEIDKVNQFYQAKETEFAEREQILHNLHDILLDLQQAVSDDNWSRMNLIRCIDATSILESNSSSSQNIDFESAEHSMIGIGKDDIIEALQRDNVEFIAAATSGKVTPTSKIVAIIAKLWQDLVLKPKEEAGGEDINKEKLRCARKIIRGAFVELYRSLGMLEDYGSLNMTAFIKILKKFDKVTKQQTSAGYLETVRKTHFVSSEKVLRLMDMVKSSFIEHFVDGDSKKAAKFLTPQQQNNSHVAILFGLFSSCFVMLLIAYTKMAHSAGFYCDDKITYFIEFAYAVFSVISLLSMHVFLYGCNLLMWKKTRINYHGILEFVPYKSLKCMDAFLICICLMTAVMFAMVLHVIFVPHGDPHRPTLLDAIPGIPLMVLFLVLVLPWKIFYRSTRFCFLRVVRNTICSPLYKVLMVDSFMADQLTSQSALLRHMQSAVCYFLSLCFKDNKQICESGKFHSMLAYAIPCLPYCWRVLQCGRRWYGESYDVNHLLNLGKYTSAIVAAVVRSIYENDRTRTHLTIVLVTSLLATVYQSYWDLVKDWGLLDLKSENLLLRDRLVVKKKAIYYIAIALNIVLRLAWLGTVLQPKLGLLEKQLFELFFASLEIIRRGIWNYFRLEYEHVKIVEALEQ